MKQIQSRDNPFFKTLLKLSCAARARQQARQTLLDGAHLLAAYLDSGQQPQHLIVNPAAMQDAEIVTLLQRVGDTIPITQLDDRLFTELSELKTPTGLLALITLPETPIVTSHFTLLLEDIQDPGNLGSMLRSAAAAGCDAAYLSTGCADAWSPKVLRAAMGGHFAMRIYTRQNLPQIARDFCGTLLATHLHATTNLYQCDLRGDLAWMIGNEGAGLSAELAACATQQIVIPMLGKMESLNAAAATAICLFETVRQRQL